MGACWRDQQHQRGGTLWHRTRRAWRRYRQHPAPSRSISRSAHRRVTRAWHLAARQALALNERATPLKARCPLSRCGQYIAADLDITLFMVHSAHGAISARSLRCACGRLHLIMRARIIIIIARGSAHALRIFHVSRGHRAHLARIVRALRALAFKAPPLAAHNALAAPHSRARAHLARLGARTAAAWK